MSFWSAIPVLGSLFDSIGNAIDKNITTDEERLKLKSEITSFYVPLVAAVVEAQKSFNEMQAKIVEVEARSEHWLVWARRPIVSLLAASNFLVVFWMSNAGMLNEQVLEFSFYFAVLANGLDMGTRGIEKIVGKLKSKEEI